MAQQQKSGKPWSGTNKIPTVNQFIERLDKDKRERDQRLDQEHQRASQNETPTPHKNEAQSTKGTTVTDPTTGKKVVIEDVGKEIMEKVEDPMVWTASALQCSIFDPPANVLLSFPYQMQT